MAAPTISHTQLRTNQPADTAGPPSSRGFSLIEVILVIAIVAAVYSIAIPQISMRTGSDAANKISRLVDDIRSAYDMSVLNNKPYRLVFEMASGNYFLEEADRRQVLLADQKLGHDPTEEEEKNEREAFAESFKDYEDLAGEVIKDPEGEEDIKPASPVVEAKSKLEKPKWSKVENLEWTNRSLGPFMLVSEIQTDHHAEKQLLQDLGEKGRAFLYFFPAGYVERAYIRVSFRRGDLDVDPDQKPFTIVTNPFTGTASILNTTDEINFEDLRSKNI